jgi:cation transport regulator
MSGYRKLAAGYSRKGGEMPYDNLSDLPDSVRNNLPRHGQEIYRAAYNSAEEQYGEEDRAHRVAWSAVENKYEKNDQGNWVEKKA